MSSPGDDRPRPVEVARHERVDRPRDHADGRPRHLRDVLERAGAAVVDQAERDLGDVLRLVADPLHVGDHLERGGDHPQVGRDRLLLEQQPQAAALDLLFLLVHPRALPDRLPGERGVLFEQRAGGVVDRPAR